MIDRLAGRKVYLDANVFIYALEEFAQYVDLCRVILQGIERNELRACTSELTLAETLARPIRENRLDLAQVYEQALQSGDSLSVVPISRSILIQSARLRALTRVAFRTRFTSPRQSRPNVTSSSQATSLSKHRVKLCE
jgi:predicted nucleic acid-binding protein